MIPPAAASETVDLGTGSKEHAFLTAWSREKQTATVKYYFLTEEGLEQFRTGQLMSQGLSEAEARRVVCFKDTYQFLDNALEFRFVRTTYHDSKGRRVASLEWDDTSYPIVEGTFIQQAADYALTGLPASADPLRLSGRLDKRLSGGRQRFLLKTEEMGTLQFDPERIHARKAYFDLLRLSAAGTPLLAIGTLDRSTSPPTLSPFFLLKQ